MTQIQIQYGPIRTHDELLRSAVSGVGSLSGGANPDAELKLLRRTITTAELATMESVGAEILPAPGPGKYIQGVRARLEITVGEAWPAFADPFQSDLLIGFASVGEWGFVAMFTVQQFLQFIEEPTDFLLIPITNSDCPRIVCENKPVILSGSADPLTIENISINMWLEYRIRTWGQ